MTCGAITTCCGISWSATPDEQLQQLADRYLEELGRVNALYCPDSFKRSTEDCQFANDPRGWGLGFLVR